jgi:23S rRNA G2069 N7-methylase RlmK/C1962 C5-methylase RlmI
MFWFDKQHPLTLYLDNRVAKKGHIKEKFNHQVNPDVVMDFRSLEFPDKTFKLIVFDPPHLKSLTDSSIFKKQFGCLKSETWQADLKMGFEECWRVLDDYGTLIFKWNDKEIKLKKVLSCFSQSPLFGHTTTHGSKTTWCVFFKG